MWAEPCTVLRASKFFNLMQDPYERADITSNTYWDWIVDHTPQMYVAMEEVPKFMESFKEFPPRSVPPSFNPANMMGETLRDIKAKQSWSARSRCLEANRRNNIASNQRRAFAY